MQLFLIKLFKWKDAITGHYLVGARLDRTPFIHILTFGGFALLIGLVISFISLEFFVENLYLASVISFSFGFGKEFIEGKLSEQGFDVLDLLGDALGNYGAYLLIEFLLKI